MIPNHPMHPLFLPLHPLLGISPLLIHHQLLRLPGTIVGVHPKARVVGIKEVATVGVIQVVIVGVGNLHLTI